MAKAELRRLNREQLLKLLLEAEEENVRLRKENARLQAQLEDRTIRTEKCGSLAQAALALNGVFEAADEACRQYVENMRQRADEMLRESEEKCRRMEETSARAAGYPTEPREEAETAERRDEAERVRSREKTRERTPALWKDRR